MTDSQIVRALARAIRWICLICASTLNPLTTPALAQVEVSEAVLEAERQRIETIQRASAATISVLAPGGNGGGSGVLVTPDGFALTNFHVVQGNGSFMQCTLPDGLLYESVLVGIDPVGDVALIKLLGRDDFPVAEIADSDNVQPGQRCFAVGNPFILATNFQPTVTTGIISGVHRYQYPSGTLLEYADCIQTDAAINPGNSGGPLFDAAGRLIGINGRGSFEKRGRVNVGVGYAISINQILHFYDHLLSGRIVDHATLGATVGTGESGEVLVTNILESSDAYFQGLRFNDRVLKFAGRDITSVNQFKNLLGIFPRGWKVPVTFEREDQTREIIVRLTGVHAEQELIELTAGSRGSMEISTEYIEVPDDEKQQLYEYRAGFANYHFNLQKQQDIHESFLQNGDFSTSDEMWRLNGVDSSGNEVVIALADEQSGIQMDGETWLFKPSDEFSDQSGSPQIRALMGLHLWRKMLVYGPGEYGDTISFGSLPVSRVELARDPQAAGQLVLQMTDRKADVLKATRGITETYFYFEPATGHLLAMDLFPDVDVPATEIHFSDYQIHDGLSVPGMIDLVTPGSQIQRIELKRFEFSAPVDGGD
ncbi:MAG: trypsin-like peptidase domain-containing protein [Planctomycetota bacterium]